MRPKIAMWSDYGASRRKQWRARSRRSSRSSIGPMILAAAVVVVAGVIGISGLYPQIIDSEWVQGMSTRSQRVSETAPENGISGIYPQNIDSEWVQGTSTHSQRVLETAPESVGMIHEPQPPSPAGPGWVAQLIGDSSETAALSRFHQMQGRLQSALGGYEPAILRTTMKPGAAPIWVRVRIEFDTRQGADSLCSKLQAAREPCLVQRNFDNGISRKSASN
jgi:hypothetical protein